VSPFAAGPRIVGKLLGRVPTCASTFLKGAEGGADPHRLRPLLLLRPIRFHGDGNRTSLGLARKGARLMPPVQKRLQMLSTLSTGRAARVWAPASVQAGRAGAWTGRCSSRVR